MESELLFADGKVCSQWRNWPSFVLNSMMMKAGRTCRVGRYDACIVADHISIRSEFIIELELIEHDHIPILSEFIIEVAFIEHEKASFSYLTSI